MRHNIVLVECSAAVAVAVSASCIASTVIPPNSVPVRIAAVSTAEVVPTDRRPTVIQAEITSTSSSGGTATTTGRGGGNPNNSTSHGIPNYFC